MKARIKWVEGMSFLGESGSGHTLLMDGSPEAGGRNLGIRPMEAILIGAGGCTSFDVILILKRSRAEVTDCVVEMDSERADTDPKVFTKIHMHFTVTGKAISPQVIERAIALSHEKYCSASIMMGKTADITTSFDVVEV